MQLQSTSGQINEPAVSIIDVPNLLNYQGFVRDNSGNPIDGRVKMTFPIYDQPAGGTVKWSETQSDVLVRDGQFAVLLGTFTPVDNSIFDEPNRYLAVQVENDSEMTPRQKIVSVGYAARAFNSENAKKAVKTDWAAEAKLAEDALDANKVGGIDPLDLILRMRDPVSPQPTIKIDHGYRSARASFDGFDLELTINSEKVSGQGYLYYLFKFGGKVLTENFSFG